jgi:hypothetical protein
MVRPIGTTEKSSRVQGCNRIGGCVASSLVRQLHAGHKRTRSGIESHYARLGYGDIGTLRRPTILRLICLHQL